MAEAKVRADIYDAVTSAAAGGQGEDSLDTGKAGAAGGASGLSLAEEAAKAFDASPGDDEDIPLELRGVDTGESAYDRAKRLSEQDKRRKLRDKAEKERN